MGALVGIGVLINKKTCEREALIGRRARNRIITVFLLFLFFPFFPVFCLFYIFPLLNNYWMRFLSYPFDMSLNLIVEAIERFTEATSGTALQRLKRRQY